MNNPDTENLNQGLDSTESRKKSFEGSNKLKT